MKVSQARKILAVPMFGDPVHIEAFQILKMLREMGSTGPNTPIDISGLECEECAGAGECSHCGQSCAECDDGEINVSPQDIEDMDEDEIKELYSHWQETARAIG